MSDGMVKFHVRLSLKTEREGGRRTPISSGFRTDIKFNDDEFRMVVLEFDKNILMPGESCDAICTALLHGEGEIDHLLNLRSTVISDGPHVIGTILIKKVLNRNHVQWSE